MKRNISAGCGTCPYWHRHPKSVYGDCRAYPEAVEKLNTEWCGQHPDFWQADAAEPPTLDNATLTPSAGRARTGAKEYMGL